MELGIELIPPDGAGPVRIGMTIAEAERALSLLPGFRYLGTPGSMIPAPGRAGFESGLTFVALSGPSGHVVGVEIFRAWRQHVPVTYKGLDVFGLHSNVVIDRLGGMTRVVEQEYGAAILAPDLLLALARFAAPETDNEEEDGAFFDSVLVAQPGYYDDLEEFG